MQRKNRANRVLTAIDHKASQFDDYPWNLLDKPPHANLEGHSVIWELALSIIMIVVFLAGITFGLYLYLPH
jgi:hypothetical protein